MELTSHGIGVGTGERWVFAPLDSWQDDPFAELIRMFHLLKFDLEIKKRIEE